MCRSTRCKRGFFSSIPFPNCPEQPEAVALNCLRKETFSQMQVLRASKNETFPWRPKSPKKSGMGMEICISGLFSDLDSGFILAPVIQNAPSAACDGLEKNETHTNPSTRHVLDLELHSPAKLWQQSVLDLFYSNQLAFHCCICWDPKTHTEWACCSVTLTKQLSGIYAANLRAAHSLSHPR